MQKLGMMVMVLVSAISTVAQAELNAGVTKSLTSKLNGSVYSVSLGEGYHFNDKAPNLATADGKQVTPKTVTPREIQFTLPKEYINAQAAVYICDDAKTFCEPRNLLIKGSETAVSGTETKKSGKVVVNSHGFIEDNILAAAERAKKEKKLIVADFSARWCPGCVRYETETFDTKDFKQLTSSLIKLKLDVDKFEVTELKKKYGVAAIPTLIVLNPDLEEISRVVDFQPMSTLRTFFREAAINPATFAELKVKADAGDMSSALVLGRRLYNAGKYSDAVAALEKVKPEPIELLDAKVQAAKPGEKPSAQETKSFQAIVRSALEKESNSSRSIVWRTLLCESLPKGDPERKKIAVEGVGLADELLANDKKLKAALAGDFVGEFEGLERLLIGFNRTDLVAAGEMGDQAIADSKNKTAEIGRQLNIPTTRTGPSMRFLLALMDAKQFPAAEEQARKLLNRDPENPELKRRLLRALNENKKFEEGVKVGKDALAGAYGKNEVWVVQQLAKAYAGNGQKAEAKALLTSYLDRKDIDWAVMKSEQKDLSEQLGKFQDTK